MCALTKQVFLSSFLSPKVSQNEFEFDFGAHHFALLSSINDFAKYWLHVIFGISLIFNDLAFLASGRTVDSFCLNANAV